MLPCQKRKQFIILFTNRAVVLKIEVRNKVTKWGTSGTQLYETSIETPIMDHFIQISKKAPSPFVPAPLHPCLLAYQPALLYTPMLTSLPTYPTTPMLTSLYQPAPLHPCLY